MPAKSGASHAGAAFLSIVLGALISNVLSAHAGLLGETVAAVGGLVAGIPGVSLSEDVTGLLVVSTLLAFLWGVAYHYSEHSPGDSGNSDTTESPPDGGDQVPLTGSLQAEDVPEDTGGKFGVATRAYQSPQAAQQTETQLRARLERDLNNVKSRCDDIHNRLYHTGKRDAAERVQALRDTVAQVERTLRQASDVHPVPVEADAPGQAAGGIDGRTRDKLVATHTDLVEMSDKLVSAVRDAHYATDVDAEVFDTCDRLASELERALDTRRTVVQRLGEYA